MTERSVTHATIVVERVYPARPWRVLAAWADAKVKARWFCPPDKGADEYSLDFRVGGLEWSKGQGPVGGTYTYEARYFDIVPDARVVTAYEMHFNGVRISVSPGTVEFLRRARARHQAPSAGAALSRETDRDRPPVARSRQASRRAVRRRGG